MTEPLGTIGLDIFNIDVAVFDSEDARHECLKDQGCNDLDRHTEAAIASSHRDFTDDGGIRLSMVIKPHALPATWAHECVHIADFVMDYLGIPMGIKNTEVRAYIVGHLFKGLQEILGDRE